MKKFLAAFAVIIFLMTPHNSAAASSAKKTAQKTRASYASERYWILRKFSSELALRHAQQDAANAHLRAIHKKESEALWDENSYINRRFNRNTVPDYVPEAVISEKYQPLIDCLKNHPADDLFPWKYSLETSDVDGSYFIYVESEHYPYRIVIATPDNDGSFETMLFDIPYESDSDLMGLKSNAYNIAQSFLTQDEAEELLQAWYGGENAENFVNRTEINLTQRDMTLEILCEINDQHYQIFFRPEATIYF